jgi:hypothetical protein
LLLVAVEAGFVLAAVAVAVAFVLALYPFLLVQH